VGSVRGSAEDGPHRPRGAPAETTDEATNGATKGATDGDTSWAAAGEGAGLDARRFVLAVAPDEGAPCLTPEDTQHALRVLRVAVGETLIGLDGRGAAWPLRVTAADRRSLAVAVAGEPERAPAPGSAAGAGPAVEVALSLPRGNRAEDLMGTLTQLGIQRLTPLVLRRSPPHAREAGAARRERLLRAGREASKQCGRLWFPEVGEPSTLSAWLAARAEGAALAWLDPYAAEGLLGWDAAHRAAPLALAFGPEGGFAPEEEAALAAHGARRARLGGHVLRLETAAAAAVAVVMAEAARGQATRE